MREDLEKVVLEIIDRFVGSAQCGYVIEKVKVTLQGMVMYGSMVVYNPKGGRQCRYAKLQAHIYTDGSIGEPWVVDWSAHQSIALDRYAAGWE